MLGTHILGTGAGFLLLGLEKFYTSLGIHVARVVTTSTQAVAIVLILLNVLFTYQVCSHKLRIHNVSCMAGRCCGNRFCDIVLVSLNWLAFLIAVILCIGLTFSGTVSLSLVALCEISKTENETLPTSNATYVAIDELIERLNVLQDLLDSTPISGYIKVVDTSTAALVCSNNTELTLAAAFMIGGGTIVLMAQVFILVSYSVVSNVSWRHMKDVHKAAAGTLGGAHRRRMDQSIYHTNHTSKDQQPPLQESDLESTATAPATVPLRRATLGSADEVFDAADTNHDGVLQPDELLAQLRGRGRSTADANKITAEVGTDKEGNISREAFRAGYYAELDMLLETVRPPPEETFDDLHGAAATPCTIGKTEERGITLRQLRAVWTHIERRCEPERWTNVKGELLKPEQVSLYDAARYVIKPATQKLGCSYVELVASAPQRPQWFVSHWWGEAVFLFLLCLEQHAADHKLNEDAPYWVCAYANNQHNLDEINEPDPSQTPFVKAIKLAEGRVVTVLDAAGVTYSRIWCCLEIFFGLGETYEVYTAKEGCEAYDMSNWEGTKTGAKTTGDRLAKTPIVSDRRAVGLTSRPCAADAEVSAAQAQRQASFPLELAQKAFEIQVQAGNASVESDRVHILNYIVGRKGKGLETLVLQGGVAAYDDTNAKLHGAFAAATWRLLLEKGADMGPVAAKLKASQLKTLSVSMRDCGPCDDGVAYLLAKSLPPTVSDLRLELDGSSATATGARYLLQSGVGLGKQLKVFHMSECMLAGSIPEALAECTALEILYLNNNQLTGSISKALGECVALQVLQLNRNKLTGIIPKALCNCTALYELRLGGNKLQGPIPTALAQCTALRILKLYNNLLTGPIPEALGKCTALEKLSLYGNQLTGPIPEELGKCTALTQLELYNNQLTGPIPAALGECTALQQLYVHNNLLTGPIPEALCKCTELKTVKLYGNQQMGPIPMAIAKAAKIGWNVLGGHSARLDISIADESDAVASPLTRAAHSAFI